MPEAFEFPVPFADLVGVLAALCAFLVGVSKSGIPGAGILAVPVMAAILPARESTGFLLPLLIVGDVFAIVYWRRHVEWRRLLRLLPWTMMGVVAGYFALDAVTSRQLMPVIGLIVLAMIALRWWRESRAGRERKIPASPWIAGGTGLLAGATSMMANAAGPIIVIYMLAMRLEKKHLIGTTAWFFFLLNVSKTPFSGNLDLINAQSLKAGLLFVPVIVCGGLLGVFLAHRIPQRLFNIVLETIAAGTALYLIGRGVF
jgi:uncharacterized membrane protein YfcA